LKGEIRPTFLERKVGKRTSSTPIAETIGVEEAVCFFPSEKVGVPFSKQSVHLLSHKTSVTEASHFGRGGTEGDGEGKNSTTPRKREALV